MTARNEAAYKLALTSIIITQPNHYRLILTESQKLGDLVRRIYSQVLNDRALTWLAVILWAYIHQAECLELILEDDLLTFPSISLQSPTSLRARLPPILAALLLSERVQRQSHMTTNMGYTYIP